MNPNTNTNNTNTNINNSSKMASTRSVKINFQASSCDVELSPPATLARLQAAVASAFGVELPERSAEIPTADGDLSFTYKDPDGDDIVFDKDSELSLALRLCPNTLEISASLKKSKVPTKTDNIERVYKVAARNMREYHGVPSMTPVKLTKTLEVFQLGPCRLVKQGLAPKKLMVAAEKSGQDPIMGGNRDEDLAEEVNANMELMTMENDRKEWEDGFVSVGAETGADMATEKPSHTANSAAFTSSSSSSSDQAGEEGDNEPKNKRKMIIHAALRTAGICIRPRETRPLLLALGVHPRRLVKLGLLDKEELAKFLKKHPRAYSPDAFFGPQKFVVPPGFLGFGAPGGGRSGKPCGRRGPHHPRKGGPVHFPSGRGMTEYGGAHALLFMAPMSGVPAHADGRGCYGRGGGGGRGRGDGHGLGGCHHRPHHGHHGA